MASSPVDGGRWALDLGQHQLLSAPFAAGASEQQGGAPGPPLSRAATFDSGMLPAMAEEGSSASQKALSDQLTLEATLSPSRSPLSAASLIIMAAAAVKALSPPQPPQQPQQRPPEPLQSQQPGPPPFVPEEQAPMRSPSRTRQPPSTGSTLLREVLPPGMDPAELEGSFAVDCYLDPESIIMACRAEEVPRTQAGAAGEPQQVVLALMPACLFVFAIIRGRRALATRPKRSFVGRGHFWSVVDRSLVLTLIAAVGWRSTAHFRWIRTEQWQQGRTGCRCCS